MWSPGTKLISETSPELGVGVVLSVDGRFIDVFFPDVDQHLRLSTAAAGIEPIELLEGDEVRLADGQVTTIERITGPVALLADGTREQVELLWPHLKPPTLVDHLTNSRVDPLLQVLHRVDGQRLLNYRRRGEVPSLIGGRVEIFPHQIATAARAMRDERVRWLLADEVGLGKTVVACMIASAMIRMGRVERVVIVTPDILTVQWLGELYRKFHQVFVHIDRERLAHVRTDFGLDANPFGVHPLSIVSAGLLASEDGLLRALEQAPPDLIVVDEAHQAFEYLLGRLLLPMVGATEHALMLTATPFQMGEEGFMRFVEALDLPHARDEDEHVVRHVSAVTRADMSWPGLRRPLPVEVSHLGAHDEEDPRVQWIVEEEQSWYERGEKSLVFVKNARRARELSKLLARLTRRRVFAFHEEMGAKKRDIELAQFRISRSTIIVSSGAGGEGRNFQFCERVVHVDLPEDPVLLEQRIGRLDRIGRKSEVPVVYFKPRGDDAGLARTYEALGLFEDASIGSSPAMAKLRDALTETSIDEIGDLVGATLRELEVQAGSWMFPDSYDDAAAETTLAEIPRDLDEILRRFCLDAAEEVGLEIVEKEGNETYYFEYGPQVEVDAIPGLAEGTRFLGTFDRQTAIDDESLDFFANGHPLVEGLLAELQDSDRGRVGALRLQRRHAEGFHGLYLLVVGGEVPDELRVVPLMHAGGTPLNTDENERYAQTLYEGLDMGIELDDARVKALMGRVANHPLLEELDAARLCQAILVVVMD